MGIMACLWGKMNYMHKIFYADVLNTEEQFNANGTYIPRQYPHPPGLFFEWYLGYVAFFLLGITRYPYVRQQYLDETWYASIMYRTLSGKRINNTV